MNKNKDKSLQHKISKKFRHSENKILQKIGQKIKPKKINSLPEYENYFKIFEFKKSDIKSKIKKNAKFKNKKITKDFIIKDYKENVYDKIIKCLKKFAKTQIHIKDQYELFCSKRGRIYSKKVDDQLKKDCENDYIALVGSENCINRTNIENKAREAQYKLDTEYLKKQNIFLETITKLKPENTHFTNSNFKKLVETLKDKKQIVIKSYTAAENEVNEKTIEENHKIIDSILKEEYDKIIKGFNEYINKLEIIQKEYKIEHDTSLKVKF